jgi:hypothetical protein
VLVLETDKCTIDDCVQTVVDFVQETLQAERQ